jgi:hypothetical protein
MRSPKRAAMRVVPHSHSLIVRLILVMSSTRLVILQDSRASRNANVLQYPKQTLHHSSLLLSFLSCPYTITLRSPIVKVKVNA